MFDNVLIRCVTVAVLALGIGANTSAAPLAPGATASAPSKDGTKPAPRFDCTNPGLSTVPAQKTWWSSFKLETPVGTAARQVPPAQDNLKLPHKPWARPATARKAVSRPRAAARPVRAAQAPLRPLHVTASAYAIHGRTARGTHTSHGTIAVDPRVIPMGSRIYVPGYGWGTALDTGGAVRGNTIDLWMPTNGQCFQWGVRRVKILVEARHPRPLLASRAGRLRTASQMAKRRKLLHQRGQALPRPQRP